MEYLIMTAAPLRSIKAKVNVIFQIVVTSLQTYWLCKFELVTISNKSQSLSIIIGHILGLLAES